MGKILIDLTESEMARARAYRVKHKLKHKAIYLAGIPADFEDGTIAPVVASNENVGAGNS